MVLSWWIPASWSPPLWVCMDVCKAHTALPSHTPPQALRRVPCILYKAFATRRVKEKWGSWLSTKIFVSFPGGLPNGKHIHISTIASPATCWSHCLQNSSWLGVPRPWLTHGGGCALWGHQWKGMFPFHTVFIFQSNGDGILKDRSALWPFTFLISPVFSTHPWKIHRPSP